MLTSIYYFELPLKVPLLRFLKVFRGKLVIVIFLIIRIDQYFELH